MGRSRQRQGHRLPRRRSSRALAAVQPSACPVAGRYESSRPSDGPHAASYNSNGAASSSPASSAGAPSVHRRRRGPNAVHGRTKAVGHRTPRRSGRHRAPPSRSHRRYGPHRSSSRPGSTGDEGGPCRAPGRPRRARNPADGTHGHLCHEGRPCQRARRARDHPMVSRLDRRPPVRHRPSSVRLDLTRCLPHRPSGIAPRGAIPLSRAATDNCRYRDRGRNIEEVTADARGSAGGSQSGKGVRQGCQSPPPTDAPGQPRTPVTLMRSKSLILPESNSQIGTQRVTRHCLELLENQHCKASCQ